MPLSSDNCFEKRFRRRALVPGTIVLLFTALLCAAGLVAAGRGVDDLSRQGQTFEALRAIVRLMDQTSLAQESIGLCDECVAVAASDRPDTAWLTDNVAKRLYELNKVHEVYVLGPDNRPVFAAVNGQAAPLERYAGLSRAADFYVRLARGEASRPSRLSNWTERLPASPVPPENATRTTAGTVHATDLIKAGGRVGILSVMRMVAGDARRPGAEAAPLLVAVRWFDDAIAAELQQQNFLAEVRLSDVPERRDGESGVRVMTSDAVPVTNLFWKPVLPAGELIRSMLPWVLLAFGIVGALVFLMARRMRRLMWQDEERLAELTNAHAELDAKQAQAYHLAYHDVLTGLPNRALFNSKAETALNRARQGEPVALAMLDLDRFKIINDRYGHMTGDRLIQLVAKELGAIIGKDGTVARIGGDEYALLLHGKRSKAEVEACLDEIVRTLRQPFDILGNKAFVGVSIGVVMAPLYGCDRTDLMRKADIALYKAKDAGRDCYRFFSREMDESVQLRAEIETDLREALTTGRGLDVHYQPVVGPTQVAGLEALARWNCPKRGWVSPEVFVTVAEECGLAAQLGEWVMAKACEVSRQWPELVVSVNLSAAQFCDEHLAERIGGIARAAGVDAGKLELEVTETVVLDPNDTVRRTLKQLRREGFRIALDDFGTGYSSLSVLREFEVDGIKIDRSFIRNLDQSAEASAIASAVVTLGHAMGLQVTAEGVETEFQERFLREIGCDLLQGFRFSKAVPARDLPRALGNLEIRAAA